MGTIQGTSLVWVKLTPLRPPLAAIRWRDPSLRRVAAALQHDNPGSKKCAPGAAAASISRTVKGKKGCFSRRMVQEALRLQQKSS